VVNLLCGQVIHRRRMVVRVHRRFSLFHASDFSLGSFRSLFQYEGLHKAGLGECLSPTCQAVSKFLWMPVELYSILYCSLRTLAYSVCSIRGYDRLVLENIHVVVVVIVLVLEGGN
jgi:hypothetical protein